LKARARGPSTTFQRARDQAIEVTEWFLRGATLVRANIEAKNDELAGAMKIAA
jgi:hypothetical protein